MKNSSLPSWRASGTHRPRRLSGPAAAVTAGIAAGSLALAAYATTATVPASSSTPTAVGESEPAVGGTVTGLSADASQDLGALAAADRLEKGSAALDLSSGLTGEGVEAARAAAERISERKAEERAAERRAAEEGAAAERAAAEQAAAEQAAAERAAAEQAAAEQAAAEEQVQAEARAESQAASRSAARQPAPEPTQEPAPQPTQQPAPQQPAPQPVSSGDARSIARSMLSSYGWGDDQWGCLESLWMKESGWNHTAMNPSSGAYGIPQSLPGSKMASAGADWQTNPATQIAWGLGYISERYGSPCNAWAHSQAVNWY